ncbi:MAG: methyltransferase domain-containing protein, partial [Thaumarchaeota archaeon]|nr:methyltransferase domain-containing protein [Nitrososphaerota archaeon]
MNQKITVNPLDVLLWNGRHSGKDIINIYTKFSPLMQIGADTKMLNFGLWRNSVILPDAQKEMSEYVADFGGFDLASRILDVGSGFCVPATIWKEKFPHLDIYCMDLNFSELNNGNNHVITQINSSSNNIPFGDKSFDRIIALESAQHFVPLEKFFEESKRTLADDGKLILAIPVTENSPAVTLKLGILNITWLSKKYTKNHVLDVIKNAGFSLKNEESIGDLVYEPFADYYIQNREKLRQKLVATYSASLEGMIFKSMKKMKSLSKQKVIDY